MKAAIVDFFRRIHARIFAKVKYIIVDFEEQSKRVTFVCYGTRAFFKMPLIEIPYNEEIILGLDTRQACFLGIKVGQYTDVELAKFKKSLTQDASVLYNKKCEIDLSFDRYGNVIFFDQKTGNPECIPAINIVKDDQILKRLSSLAAYSVGVFVGKNIRLRASEYFEDKSNIADTNIVNITVHRKIK